MSDHDAVSAGRDVLQFEGLCIDESTGQLVADGETVRLAPQPLRLLAYLARNNGRVVSRDELHQQVWRGRHVAFNEALNFAVREIRRRVPVSRDGQWRIETIPRKGYRFVGRAKRKRAESKAAIRPTLVRAAGLFRRSGLVLALLAFVLLLVWRSVVAPLTRESVYVVAAGESAATRARANDLVRDVSAELRRRGGVRMSPRPEASLLLEIRVDEQGRSPAVISTMRWARGRATVWRSVVRVPDFRSWVLGKAIALDVSRVCGELNERRRDGIADVVVVERASD